jgi:hypothetical protein
MKKLIYLCFLSFLIFSCAKEEIQTTVQNDQEIDLRGPKPKVDVCHYDADNDSWHVINISENALPAHLAHGDVLLVDADEDGWVEAENECVPGGDCNDDDASINPGAEEVCDDDMDNNCNGEVDEGCVPSCENNADCLFCDDIQPCENIVGYYPWDGSFIGVYYADGAYLGVCACCPQTPSGSVIIYSCHPEDGGSCSECETFVVTLEEAEDCVIAAAGVYDGCALFNSPVNYKFEVDHSRVGGVKLVESSETE